MKTILGVLSAVFFIACLAQAQNKPSQDTIPKAPSIDTTQVTWYRYDEGLKLAKATGKHILVNFTTTWCGYCKKMDKETFHASDAVRLINEGFVAIKVDGDSPNELNIDGYKITEKNLARSEYRVSGYPTFWILKANADRVGDIRGYKPKEQFMDMLAYIKDGVYEKMKFDEYMKNGGRKGPQK